MYEEYQKYKLLDVLCKKQKKQLTVPIWEGTGLCCLAYSMHLFRNVFCAFQLSNLNIESQHDKMKCKKNAVLSCKMAKSFFNPAIAQWSWGNFYLEQPLRVVLHGHLQLLQPLRRLVLVLRSILLKWIVGAAAALTLAVLLLGQQKGVAARPVLDLILSFSRSTVFCPETEAES